jgi:hypothetical protein
MATTAGVYVLVISTLLCILRSPVSPFVKRLFDTSESLPELWESFQAVPAVRAKRAPGEARPEEELDHAVR